MQARKDVGLKRTHLYSTAYLSRFGRDNFRVRCLLFPKSLNVHRWLSINSQFKPSLLQGLAVRQDTIGKINRNVGRLLKTRAASTLAARIDIPNNIYTHKDANPTGYDE